MTFDVQVDDICLSPWEFKTSADLVLRGHQSPLTGKPIVHFVHGNGFSVLTYLPLLRYLLPHVDMILTNTQGHGASDRGESFQGWGHSSELITEFIQSRAQSWQDQQVPVIGMGHSFGAAMTTLAAGKKDVPFDALILLDPVFLPLLYSSLVQMLAPLGVMRHTPIAKLTRQRRDGWTNREEAWNSFYKRGVFKNWHDDALNAYLDYSLEQKGEELKLVTPPWLEVEIFAGHPEGLWSLLPQLDLPIRGILGKDTYDFAKAGFKRAIKVNEQIQQRFVSGEHCYMMEYPEQSAQAIIDELKQLSFL